MCFPCCYMLSKGISFWRFDDGIFLDSLFMDKKAFLQELIWKPCIFWFHDEIFEIFFFSCQLCFGLKTEIFISILVTQSHTLSPSVRCLFELRAILGFSQGIHMPVSHSAYYPTWKSCKTVYNSSGNPISIGKATSQASCPLTLLVSRAWQRQELHF